ncbi:MAG: hypothetical protein KDH20_01605 [Rhodocyclaceae bacterium]|nr:hypothetical protein [Rhodocyclaceae bacterium]
MRHALPAIAAYLLTACSAIVSSNPVLDMGGPWDGPVLITPARIPDGVKFEVVGSIQAEARTGYSGAASLYPLLADEARRIGANAVVRVQDGRSVSGFSWSAPHVTGMAVRVEGAQAINGVPGSFY